MRAAARRLGTDRALELALAALRRWIPGTEVRVSVVIPTIGRATLQRAVDSAGWADEVIVVYDAALPPVDPPSGASVYAVGPTHHFGAEQRHLGIEKSTGTHIAFLDDDDVYTDDAGRAVRRALVARPGRVHIFKMRDAEREYGGPGCVVQGSIGSPMFVVPKDGRLGRWSTRYEGDFDFISSTLARRGDRPCFHDQVIASVRPGEPPGRP